ncbi:methyl-accepting chemotaxis protein [Erwinia oleae]|uniref:methyl-accepting chemotaxis protein n=1 Tax=Erwinia oleae TaxID=796334 RepID=UPI00068E1989|nr:methyl-accepting chemotaxis protein [Erwinia oleae]
MRQAGPFSWFADMKVGHKLASGFSVIIVSLILIGAISVLALKGIQDNSQRRATTIDMVGSFGSAKLNRTLYQYTNDIEYADKNGQALQDMVGQYNKLQSFSWDSEGQSLVTEIGQALKDYTNLRDILIADMKSMMGKAITLRDLPFLLIARQLDSIPAGTLSPELALNVAQLSSELKEIKLVILEATTTPTTENLSALNALMNNVTALTAAFDASGNPQLTPIDTAVRNAITSANHELAGFDDIWQAHGKAAGDLATRAKQFDNTIKNMFVYQSRISSHFVDSSKWTIGGIALAAVLVSIIIARLISSSITQPLRQTLAVAQQIAAGDLTADVHSTRKDEPGQLLQAVATMNHSLKDIIYNVRNGIQSVMLASGEIAVGNNDLSSRTEEQAAAVVETAASMEQLTATVKQNTDNARHASTLAVNASTEAARGGDIIGKMTSSMKSIKESSAQIADITSVINSIAFQTNILALNAAVESARAGEHGRGFAVVAEEVRALAQRSATAAREIEGLIAKSVAQVEEGASHVDGASESMAGIQHSVAQVSELMTEIATASEEQNRGIEQIGRAMTEMDSTTQQNAALVEQSSAAANALEDQAQQLNGMIAVFRIDEGQPAPAPVRAAPAATHFSGSRTVAGKDASWVAFNS